MTAHFTLLTDDGAARRGEVLTPHGVIRTPAFMPVGTAASVKAMFPDHVRQTGADVVLANTYHLMLRPGAERMASLGGLHRFMNWPGPILTDSGGYQVMSLSGLRQVDEDGVVFRSHIDGGEHRLTPESAVEIQNFLGSDIQMVLDECVRWPAESDPMAAAMRRSMRWAERARHAFLSGPRGDGRAQYGIVQGGIDEALRRESAESLVAIGFEGYGIGGLAVGEGHAAMLSALDVTVPHLPTDSPRYLMGVGTPADIVESVRRGVDMFDCVLPTRAGRHGVAWTREGKLTLSNACHADDSRPLDAESDCPAARDYSRAYLHHLVKSREFLGAMLLTWNNLAFYQRLMSEIRAAIEAGRFADFTLGEAGAGPEEPEKKDEG